MNKRGIALAQIFILTSSIIAFSFILNISFVSADAGSFYGQTDAGEKKTPPVATIPTHARVISPVESSSSGYIISVGGEQFFTSKQVEANKELIGINTISGESKKILIGESTKFNPATTFQYQFVRDNIDIDGKTTTLYNALTNPSLKQKLIDNPKLLEGTGIKSISQVKDGLKLDYEKSSTIINPATKEIISSTEKIPGSSYLSETLGLRGGTYTDAIVSGAQWAVVVGVGSYMIADFLGADEGQSKAIGVALGAGTFVGKSLNTLFSKGGEWSSWFGDKTLGMTSGQFSFAAGAATAAIIFLAMYKSEETETKTFTCDSWQAPTGGTNCEKCNKQGELPCSEYQCKSLGQSCELLNQGTEDEACTWAWKMEKEFENNDVKISFEELNVVGGELVGFVYKIEYEGEMEYMKCVRTYEYDEEFQKEGLSGIFLLFEE